MSDIKNAIINSLHTNLDEALSLTQSGHEVATIIDALHQTANDIHIFCAQISFQYSYEYSTLYFKMLDFVRKTSDAFDQNDLKVIEQFTKHLQYVFNYEMQDKIDVLIYKHILKQTKTIVTKYADKCDELGDITLYIGFVLEDEKMVCLQEALGSFCSGVVGITPTTKAPKVGIENRIGTKLINSLKLIYRYLQDTSSMPSVFDIHASFESGKLQVRVVLGTINMDFSKICQRAFDLGIITQDALESLTEQEAFELMLLEEYFDLDNQFIAFKQVQLEVGILGGRLQYIKNNGALEIVFDMPTDIICNGYVMNFYGQDYFIARFYIEAFELLQEATTTNIASLSPTMDLDAPQPKNGHVFDYLNLMVTKSHLNDTPIAIQCGFVIHEQYRIQSLQKNIHEGALSEKVLGVIEVSDGYIIALDINAIAEQYKLQIGG